jgi:FKBP-type peptidyl-prolyl cis-trans isomerase (trigger factor)
MKTQVKKLEGNLRELIVEAEGAAVKQKFEEVFVRLGKEAKIPGFRPGNAPRDMVEKNYGHLAHEQVLKELVPDVYNQALDKEGLDAIELPEITEVKLERESLSFKAKVEVSPDIDPKNYRGIKIDYKTPVVSEDDVKRSIDSLKESRKLEQVDDLTARSLGYPNLGELKNAIERQILAQRESAERQRIENEIIEAVLKGLNFNLPQSLVKRQIEDMVRQTKVDLALKGVTREKIEEHDSKIREEIKPEAEKQVRVYLVLSAIARLEKIELDEHMPRRVMEFLLREAGWNEAGS